MGLLYDQLCAQAAGRGMDGDVLEKLLTAPVYEVSNVVKLAKDWETERNRPIQKRPPHDSIWVEWEQEEDGPKGYGHWTTGAWIRRDDHQLKKWVDTCQYANLHKLNGAKTAETLADEMEKVAATYAEFYSVLQFSRLNRHVVKDVSWVRRPENLITGRIELNLAEWVFCLDDEQTNVRTFSTVPVDENGNPLPRYLFGLPQVLNIYEDPSFPINCPWPPFMAFSLLHCKNVSTEIIPQHDPHAERRRNKGLPPKTSYHVLRLELPSSLRPHAATPGEEESERKMRFHLCRGHFKHLTHERYKNPGFFWWPSHWRGDAKLGTVDKSYELRGKGG